LHPIQAVKPNLRAWDDLLKLSKLSGIS